MMGFRSCRLRDRPAALLVSAALGLLAVNSASGREVRAELKQTGNEVIVLQSGKKKVSVTLGPARTISPGAGDCLAERTYDEAYLAANCLVVIRGVSTCGGDPARLQLEVFTLNGKKVNALDWQRDRFLAADWRTSPDGDWAISAWSMDGHTEFNVLDSSGKIRKRVVEPAFDSWGEHEPAMGFEDDGSFVMLSPPWAKTSRALRVEKKGAYRIVVPPPAVTALGLIQKVQSDLPTPSALAKEEIVVLSNEIHVAAASYRSAARMPAAAPMRVLDKAGGWNPAVDWKLLSESKPSRRGQVDEDSLRRLALRNLDRVSLRDIQLPAEMSWVNADDWRKPTLDSLSGNLDKSLPPLMSLSLPAISTQRVDGRIEAIGSVIISQDYSGDTYFFGLTPSRNGWAVGWMEHEEYEVTARLQPGRESSQVAQVFGR